MGRYLSAEAVIALARRPSLWLAAARLARAMVAPGWWKRRPWLPLPSRPYLQFRLQAMYGPGGGRLTGEELVGYLQWCQEVRACRLRSSHARSWKPESRRG